MNIEDVKRTIVEFLNETLSPWLIILFGSLIKGNFRKNSDIDIAYFSDKDIDNYERFLIAQELANILNRDVDLIDLKKTSTVFRTQIISTGEVIFCADETRKMYFFMRTFKEYALLNEEREIVLKSLFEGSNKPEC
ncbi:DNA polymerase, beta domain protein region [Caldicellulosiruptor saccharolyticus DSM 8903]|uniref:DNA polymerase, beta domain protein region n=1 Tax=Caldicellulosiruptor saccharolyticus (strain ATCC 43494 / DSM 8903 / Tp8T 6331) TaxID=351627 RepID=A4XH29_CALS8|nr:nucleotidyltransferase domain-containing protein [Caldicellulosiruptor saccharolyticus]ABP66214.1 DNA polymerase, beta domain protein region [Caldicellulosiruptor saccharolyticus DSM 8903]